MVGRRRRVYVHSGYEPLVLLQHRGILPQNSYQLLQVVADKGPPCLSRSFFRPRRNTESPVVDYGALQLLWTWWTQRSHRLEGSWTEDLIGGRMAGAFRRHERHLHPVRRSRGWSGAVRGESTPSPVMSGEYMDWLGNRPCSVIRAKISMRTAVKNSGVRRSVGNRLRRRASQSLTPWAGPSRSQALSPSHIVQSLAPTDPKTNSSPRSPQSDSSCRLFPAKRALRSRASHKEDQ